ncbi:hypothetical protein [Gottfriedia acidiceleris]|uniref:hypothetical protein n=1 Tax=Gottfriedia acidiceleris TaxID=371036 RepID=UPI002FFFDD72
MFKTKTHSNTSKIVKIMIGLSEEIKTATMLLSKEQSKTEDIIVVVIDFLINPIAMEMTPTLIAEIDIYTVSLMPLFMISKVMFPSTKW